MWNKFLNFSNNDPSNEVFFKISFIKIGHFWPLSFVFPGLASPSLLPSPLADEVEPDSEWDSELEYSHDESDDEDSDDD